MQQIAHCLRSSPWRTSMSAPRLRCVLHPPDRRLCPIMDANSAKDSLDVHLDSGLCAIKLLRDGLVRISFNKAVQNQLLSWRELRRDLVSGKDWIVVVQSVLFAAKNNWLKCGRQNCRPQSLRSSGNDRMLHWFPKKAFFRPKMFSADE